MSVAWSERTRTLGRTRFAHVGMGIALALTVGVLVHEGGHAVAAWILGARHIHLDLWAWPPRTLYRGEFTAAGWAWIDAAGGLATFVTGLLLAVAVRRWAAPGSWVREVGLSAGGGMAILDNAQWAVLPIRYALSSRYAADMWWQSHYPREMVPDSVKFILRSHATPWAVAGISTGLVLAYVVSLLIAE